MRQIESLAPADQNTVIRILEGLVAGRLRDVGDLTERQPGHSKRRLA